jgi:hypothetical protein
MHHGINKLTFLRARLLDSNSSRLFSSALATSLRQSEGNLKSTFKLSSRSSSKRRL